MAGKRIRRSYDEIIVALKQKVASLEEKKRAKLMKEDPSLKLAKRIARMLRKAESEFLKARRTDLANAAKAAYISLESVIRAAGKP